MAVTKHNKPFCTARLPSQMVSGKPVVGSKFPVPGWHCGMGKRNWGGWVRQGREGEEWIRERGEKEGSSRLERGQYWWRQQHWYPPSWPWCAFPDPLRLVPAKLLMQVQEDPTEQQMLTTRQDIVCATALVAGILVQLAAVLTDIFASQVDFVSQRFGNWMNIPNKYI